MTCKIAGCKRAEYRARLCLPCYDYWRLHSTLPKRPAEAPQEEPTVEQLLEAEQAKTLYARKRAEDFKRQRDEAQAERDAARAQVSDQAALLRATDALVDAAADLPDVVKTHALRAALSHYRKVRGNAPNKERVKQCSV